MSTQTDSSGNLRGDVLGGITAGIVALPLALGFGIASGVENGAAAGLYGAIAVGFLAALFGGTPTQVSGPTGPMTVIVAGMIAASQFAPEWVFAAVALAGVFQVLLGVLKLGRYINYVPYPVISGFMSGIGVIIVLLQVAQLLGHKPASGTITAVQRLPEDFAGLNAAAMGLGLATIAVVYAVPRVTKAVPPALVALIGVSLASVLLGLDVPRIGEIPRGLPDLQLPAWDPDAFRMILVPAFMIAVVGSLDSLLTSLVADALTKTRHNSERELFGQGLGNLLAGVIGGLPGAGATMRTVINIRSGASGRLSGVVAALLLAAVLIALGPYAAQIPMAVLAGILITVGIGIIDVKGLRHVPTAPRGDSAVMLVVLGLTVFDDLITAVGVGMVMAAMILLKRLSDVDPATHSPLEDIAAHQPWVPPLDHAREVLSGVWLVELHGSLFFGNAGPLQRQFENVPDSVRAVVVHLGDSAFLDQSGVYMLTNMIDDLAGRGAKVFFAELQEEPAMLLERMGVAPGKLPASQVFDSAERAIEAALADAGV